MKLRSTRLIAVLACAAATVALQAPATTADGVGAPATAKAKNGNIIFSGWDYNSDDFAVWQAMPRSAGGGRASTWIDDSGSPGLPSYPGQVRLSLDGTKAAYAVHTYPGSPLGAIIVRDVSTGSVLQVLEGLGVRAQSGIDWSPDATQLVISEQRQVSIVDLGTGTLQAIYARPNKKAFIGDVRWSPDGKWIAFATEGDTVSTIKSLRPNGTGGHTVTSQATSTGIISALDWSPDSSRLAYVDTHRDPITVAITSTDLLTIHKSGGDVVDVSALAGGPEAGRYFTYLAWAPDGQRIAAIEFLSNPPLGQFFAQVRAYKADGSGKYWVTVNQTTGQSTQFDWAPQLP